MKTLLLTVTCIPVVAMALNCRPPINPKQPQFLVGYGSLMNRDSQKRTDQNVGNTQPIWLNGFRRGFYLNHKNRPRIKTVSTTFLAIYPQPHSRLNALAIALPPAHAITNFDNRESAYCRINVTHQIQPYDKATSLPKGQYWVYSTTKQHLNKPERSFPIVQSYVDLFLSGCIQIQKQFSLTGFADQCVTTTHNWSADWVNDRLYPRRPFIYQPFAFTIDRLLYKHMPKLFSQIKIE